MPKVTSRRVLRLGHKRQSLAVILPKQILDYLSLNGYALPDLIDIELVELNNKQELLLRLKESCN